MARFTVRVELFGKATEDHYDDLHEKMQASKYFRVIASERGTWYHLPTATYNHETTSSASDVRDEVFAIARKVWHDPGVFITMANGSRPWEGLRKASLAEVKTLTS